MKIIIEESVKELARKAGENAEKIINRAIRENGEASIIVATGASQDEIINYLTRSDNIDWSKVVFFHLDEYIGVSENHPASFRRYLKERFINKVDDVKEVCFVEGDADNPDEECKRIGSIIADHDIDIAFVGIGENGHLAFNDPPADFETIDPYIIVELDERCRMQQVNEGCFSSIDMVPQRAISMSVQQVMKSKSIICFVPELRKSVAVKDCLENEISNMYPSSILRTHSSCFLYLDMPASSKLEKRNCTEFVLEEIKL